MGYYGRTTMSIRGSNLPSSIFNSLNKWLYFTTDNRPRQGQSVNPLQKLIMTFNLKLDKTSVDNYVALNNLPNYDCPVNEAFNLCRYIRSFGLDGNDTDFSTHSQTTANFNNNANITNTEEDLTKKTSSIDLTKGLNLVGFKGDTKLKDLSGCEIGKYTKGKYNGKKAIFGVIGRSFIIEPTNTEEKNFTKNMGVFIFVKNNCKLSYKYSNGGEIVNQETCWEGEGYKKVGGKC